ncbi:TetR family transcriptional regulator [Gordonia rubripertincta]|uniref:TetR family transcriptional regulator n=2 Tax=Gordonia rubripertincta TaxID=36822 RepID=A0AAW6R9I5_GORRU|nr:TetR family transcriptional regulator [Gordonia rubripertincta]MDG6781030.1 TetR family transcriptional regulator [Gordonia rubripertincta]NKY62490.1 TetR family transcriptional regulator [Gordonia rubripertincta]GAB86230.1 putative TetR family transcriptional regulator [Gordonia rubripertincta NBRC 101908]
MARPSKPLINREAAVQASLEIIDAEGLDAFSLPRLATHLGVRAPSLYHHFRDKNELLAEVAVRVAGPTRRPRVKPGPDWPEYFIRLAVNFRQSVLRHRNAAPILLTHLPRAHLLAVQEDCASFLSASGVPTELHVRILEGVQSLVIGGVLMEALHPPRSRSSVVGEVSPDTAPHLARALVDNHLTPRRLFESRVSDLLYGTIREHRSGARDHSALTR